MSATTDGLAWAQDMDVYDPGFVSNPYDVWEQMRAAGCPVAHTAEGASAPTVMPITREGLSFVAQNPQIFSSRALEVTGPIPVGGPRLYMPPITSDPPEHAEFRRVILPFFTRNAIADLEVITRAKASALAAEIATRSEVDAALDYAGKLPLAVIVHMLGVPRKDEDQFSRWVVQMLKEGPKDFAVRKKAIREIEAYFEQLTHSPEALEIDGLVGYLCREKGELGLDDRTVTGMCFLLLVAGIDTTWSAIGSSIWHLATHPEDVERLREDPSLMDTAIEEFLRAYAPVTIARVASVDTEVSGCPVPAGTRVVLPWAAANRDPEEFENPQDVLIDRRVNRHIAFGLGIHRCAGSNLARMELKVALEEWLAHIPTFRVDPSKEVPWTGANVRGPESLPLLLG